MTAPTVDPLQREDVEAPDSYQPGDEVWVHRNGKWRPGVVRDRVVRGLGPWALVVDFVPAAGGNATDTVQPEFVMRPVDEDEGETS